MTQNYFHVAIHEAGHAVAYLAAGISVDSITLDCDTLKGRTIPSEGPKSVESNAVITLAGVMAEHIAYEKDVIGVSPTPFPDFDDVPEEMTDDESRYRPQIDMLQRKRSDLTTKDIDLAVKHETRGLIVQHWKSLFEIASTVYFAPERRNSFSGENEKCLDGTIIEKIFKEGIS